MPSWQIDDFSQKRNSKVSGQTCPKLKSSLTKFVSIEASNERLRCVFLCVSIRWAWFRLFFLCSSLRNLLLLAAFLCGLSFLFHSKTVDDDVFLQPIKGGQQQQAGMIHIGVYLAVICFAVAVSAQQRCCMTHSLTNGAAGMDQASYYTLPDSSFNLFFENNLN